MTGIRATQKALLIALLEPVELLKGYESEGDFSRRLALLEELKSMPWGAVWQKYCNRNKAPVGLEWVDEVG